MALVHKDGKYIKVIRDRCEFRPGSVLVSYYEFDSREDRDTYFKREREINEFFVQCTKKSNDLELQAAEELSKFNSIDLQKLGEPEELPKDVQKLFNKATDLILDLQLIHRDWKNSNFSKTKFKNKKYLFELGFKDEWFTPVKLPVISTLNTGAYINQTFSYDCLYKELKKIFKNDFVDC